MTASGRKEGIVAKHLTDAYRPRTRCLKIENPNEVIAAIGCAAEVLVMVLLILVPRVDDAWHIRQCDRAQPASALRSVTLNHAVRRTLSRSVYPASPSGKHAVLCGHGADIKLGGFRKFAFRHKFSMKFSHFWRAREDSNP